MKHDSTILTISALLCGLSFAVAAPNTLAPGQGTPEPKVWQHDIFRKDGTPYGAKELALFKETTRQGPSSVAAVAGQWPAEKAWQWRASRPWLVGCNFLPSTAVNDIEMWQKGTFDPKTIDRELGWARELGFNTVRVFLNFVVWREDAAGL